jgi:hypothetical protein
MVLRRAGGEEGNERDALLHPPDARPRAPAMDFVPCTPEVRAYGVSPHKCGLQFFSRRRRR